MLVKREFILYKSNFFVQLFEVAMSPWQLRAALLLRQVERVEVLSLRSCGYAVQVITVDGRVQALLPTVGGRLWPSLSALKGRLRSCGVRRILLLERQTHDEIIGRPSLYVADPGMPMLL